MRAIKVGMSFEVQLIHAMPGKDVVIKFAANERRPASLMEVLFCTVVSQINFRKADCMGGSDAALGAVWAATRK